MRGLSPSLASHQKGAHVIIMFTFLCGLVCGPKGVESLCGNAKAHLVFHIFMSDITHDVMTNESFLFTINLLVVQLRIYCTHQ